jgi:hypothetical protein
VGTSDLLDPAGPVNVSPGRAPVLASPVRAEGQLDGGAAARMEADVIGFQEMFLTAKGR